MFASNYLPPKVNRIFILSNEHQPSGQALAALDWMKDPQANAVQCFPDKRNKKFNAFAGMRKNDFQRMVYLGHANTQTYGDYTAKEFAQRFANEFAQTGLPKSIEINLDLLGCELGLINENGESFAQNLVDELKKRGFTQLKVRAVASPIQVPSKQGMIVEVQSGAYYYGGQHPGHIGAYLLDSEEKAILDEALAQDTDPSKAITDILGRKPISFLDDADPAIVLARAENTFIAGETPKARRERIQQDAEYQARQQQSEKRVESLRLLNIRLQQVQGKLKKANNPVNKKGKFKKFVHLSQKKRFAKLAENLALLITAVENASEDQWQATLTFNLQRFNTILMVREKISTTYNFLKLLSEGNTKKAAKKIDAKPSTSVTADNHPDIHIPTSITRKKPHHDTSHNKTEKKHTIHTAGIIQTIEKVVDAIEKVANENEVDEANHYGSTPENQRENARRTGNQIRQKWGAYKEESMQQAVKEIKELIRTLDSEIEKLNSGCCAWLSPFKRYETHTKILKRDALQDLLEDTPDFSTLQEKAKSLKDNPEDSRVFRGKKANDWHGSKVVNRTGTLIEKIVNGPDNFSPEEPSRRKRIN